MVSVKEKKCPSRLSFVNNLSVELCSASFRDEMTFLLEVFIYLQVGVQFLYHTTEFYCKFCVHDVKYAKVDGMANSDSIAAPPLGL